MSNAHYNYIADIMENGRWLDTEYKVLYQYRKANPISIDLETWGAANTKEGLSHKRGYVAVIALHAEGLPPAILHYPKGSDGPSCGLMRFLERKTLVGHNINAFDIPFLGKYGFRPMNSVGYVDTLVAEQLAMLSGRRDLKKDLATTLKRRLKVEINKQIDHKGWGNETLTNEQIYYVLNDVTLLQQLWQEQWQIICKNKLEDAWQLEHTIAPIVSNMVLQGMPIDLEVVDTLASRNEESFGNLLDDLMDLIETDAVNSPKQLKAAFLNTFGYELLDTKRDTLLQLSGKAGQLGKAAGDVSKAREFRKRGMYGSKWLDRYYNDGRINSRYVQLGTDTSRFAARDPNLQQIPSNMREMFGYDGAIGRSILKCDYCCHPDTLVLTTNLEWVKISTLNINDTLIGFDEDVRLCKGYSPKYKSSRVEAIKTVRRPCSRITTDKGVIIASRDHYFVAQHATINDGRKWLKTKELRKGMRLSYAWKPWELDTSYEGGYIAGIFDGEGYLDKTGSLGYSQKEGIVNDTMTKYLTEKGYTRTSKSVNQNCVTSYMMGGEKGSMHLIGSLRPPRLLAQANRLWENRKVGSRYQKAAVILNIENIGYIDTIAIQTSEKTFIAEGFLTHNSQIEALIFALQTKEYKLINWYRTGRDIHSEVAANLFNKTVQEIDLDKKNGGTLRKTAKACTFAMLFAGGKASVIRTARKEGINISDYDARILIHNFFRTFPNAGAFIDQQRLDADKAVRDQYGIILKLPNGPKRALYGADITASRLVNTVVQGTASVGLKLGLVECLKANIAQYIIAVVHDEVVLDVPTEEVVRVQQLLEQCMKDGMRAVIGLEPKVESAHDSHWPR